MIAHRAALLTAYRIPPVLSLLFLCSSLDRTNVGNAKIIGLGEDTGITNLQHSQGLAVFHATYIARRVLLLTDLVDYLAGASRSGLPSNLVLKKISPKIWLPVLDRVGHHDHVSGLRKELWGFRGWPCPSGCHRRWPPSWNGVVFVDDAHACRGGPADRHLPYSPCLCREHWVVNRVKAAAFRSHTITNTSHRLACARFSCHWRSPLARQQGVSFYHRRVDSKHAW